MQSPREHEIELEQRKQQQLLILNDEKELKKKQVEEEIAKKAGRVGTKIVAIIVFAHITSMLGMLLFGVLSFSEDFETNKYVIILELVYMGVPFLVTLIFLLINIIKLSKCIKHRKLYSWKIDEIEKEYAKKVMALEAQIKQWNKNYSIIYRNKINDQSVNFANSEVAQEIIELLSNEFSKNIDALQRSNNIKFITCTYSFKVYYNKIISSYALCFDFDVKRCKNLSGLVEQEALAKVLATQVQLNIIMKYNEDPSGTPVRIDTKYAYPEDRCVEIILDYTELNGNYEQVRNW